MNANDLTAKYICGRGEETAKEVIDQRLQMALHVYEAMPTVRRYLIEGIFKEVGEKVSKEFASDEPEYETGEQTVYLRTSDTSRFWVFAYLYDQQAGDKRRRDEFSFVAGVYADEPFGPQQDEIRERLDAVDLQTWTLSKGSHNLSKDHWIGYAGAHHELGASLSYDGFLRRAIEDRDGIVSALEELLTRICRGIFPLAAK